MPKSGRSRALRWATLVHRWLGIPLSLLFVMWFGSGAVMLFVPFPSLSGAERLRVLPEIDAGEVVVPPRSVLSRIEGPAAEIGSLRLIGRGEELLWVAGSTDEKTISGRVGVSRSEFSTPGVPPSVRPRRESEVRQL